MKKKRAIRNFILLSILIVICFVFSFVGFNVPTTTNRFKGFINSIPLSLEYGNGVMAIYDVETADYFDGTNAEALNKTVERVTKMVHQYYNEAVVSKYGENQIKIVVPDTGISSELLVGEIEIFNGKYDATSNSTPIMTGKHIKDAKYQSGNGTPYVYIEFNEEGKAILSEQTTTMASSSSGGTIYIYLGKDYTSSEAPFIQLSIDQAIDTGYLPLSGGRITTRAIAEMYVNRVNSGLIGTNMTINGDVLTFASSANAVLSILSIVILLILIILSFVYAYIKYKELGLVIILSMLFFTAIGIVGISLPTFIQMSFVTILGLALAYVITFITHIFVVEEAKKEFYLGKKLPASLKSGHNKSLSLLTDIFVVTFGISLISYLAGVGAIKAIASVVGILMLVGAFTAMLLFRGLISWYLNINSVDFKKVNFVKGENLNEEK